MKANESELEARIERYSVFAYRVGKNPSGDLVRVEDVIEFLEYCLSHDDYISGRINSMIDFLLERDKENESK